MTPSEPQDIAVVIPYYGHWPQWLPATLTTMAYNNHIDWFLVSNLPLNATPSNVHLIEMPLTQLHRRLERAAGHELVLPSPYKICDYRPLFGLAFADILTLYEFWGHADLDVLFGDIRGFLTKHTLSRHDKILIRGNFALYRNREVINNLFRGQGGRWAFSHVAQTARVLAFDEWGGIYGLVLSEKLALYNPDIIFDLKVSRFRPTANSAKHRNCMYTWENGKAFEYRHSGNQLIRREGLLVHFQKRNMLLTADPEGPIWVSGARLAALPPIHDRRRMTSSYSPTDLPEMARFHLRREANRARGLLNWSFRRV